MRAETRAASLGQMRVIFVCAAGLGHVYPLLPLARAAVAACDEVLFVTAGDGAATINAFGFPAVAVPAQRSLIDSFEADLVISAEFGALVSARPAVWRGRTWAPRPSTSTTSI